MPYYIRQCSEFERQINDLTALVGALQGIVQKAELICNIFEVHDYPEIEALPVVNELREELEGVRNLTPAKAGEQWRAMKNAVDIAKGIFVPGYTAPGSKCNSMECRWCTIFETCPYDSGCPEVEKLKQALFSLT